MPDTTAFFNEMYRNAKQNAIIIMDSNGIILEVNEAFTTSYGYTTEDLREKHFRILYIEKDQITKRPEIELNLVHREGSGPDDNYLVHKDGTPIWVAGESVLVKTHDMTYVVKIIHNIHAQKQLERFLLASNEVLDSLFNSVQQTGLLLLDTQLRTLKANHVFSKLFGMNESVQKGIRLQEIAHPFWQEEEIKADVRNALVNKIPINKDYILKEEKEAGLPAKFSHLHIVSRHIHAESSEEK